MLLYPVSEIKYRKQKDGPADDGGDFPSACFSLDNPYHQKQQVGQCEDQEKGHNEFFGPPGFFDEGYPQQEGHRQQ